MSKYNIGVIILSYIKYYYMYNIIYKIVLYILYICGMYPSILNYGYRQNRIFSYWTKYEVPREMKEDRQENKIEGNGFHYANHYLMNSRVLS